MRPSRGGPGEIPTGRSSRGQARGVDPVTVLFIGGPARSGSTLLDRILGQVPGFFSVGELSYVWTRSFQRDQRCGCGSPFRSCEVWSGVVREALGARPEVDPGRVRALKRSVERLRHLHRLLWPALRGGRYSARLEEYGEALARLYRAIRDATGAAVVVDSSKTPLYALALRAVPSVDLRVVHLVRDSRAVAYSWLRHRPTPDAAARRSVMPTYPPRHSALRWDLDNALLEVLRVAHRDYLRVRYEELVSDPERVVRGIVGRLGMDPGDLPFLGAGAVRLEVGHTVSGNPMRFSVGEVPIRPDREWEDRMEPGARRLVTALTLPFLLRYGYPARPGHRGGKDGRP